MNVLKQLPSVMSNILHSYLGVVIVIADIDTSLIDPWIEGYHVHVLNTIDDHKNVSCWTKSHNKKYKQNLVDVMAFTKWTIPQNKAFSTLWSIMFYNWNSAEIRD